MRFYFRLIMLLLVVVCSGCRTPKVASQWTGEPITIDGEMTDWDSLRRTAFDDDGILVGIANDSGNVYCLLRSRDATLKEAITRGGLTVWIDSTGRKKKNVCLRYRSMSGLAMPEPGERMPGSGGTMPVEPAMPGVGELLLSDGEGEARLAADGPEGFAAGTGRNVENPTYELRIPLQAGDSTRFALNARPGQTIALGLEWGGMDPGDRDKMRDRKKDRGGIGGMPPGGMSGGMPPGGMDRGGGKRGEMKQKMERQKLWIRVPLASMPE